MEAMRMGEVSYLADEEAEKAMASNDRVVDRSWALWRLETTGGA
jgi:HCOMODA/2-hydroxy-3-carboxy-muconic semialdehyde decarboxylase